MQSYTNGWLTFLLKNLWNNYFEIIAAKAEVLDDVMKYMNELKSVIPLLADVAKHLSQEQVGALTIIPLGICESLVEASFICNLSLGVYFDLWKCHLSCEVRSNIVIQEFSNHLNGIFCNMYLNLF